MLKASTLLQVRAVPQFKIDQNMNMIEKDSQEVKYKNINLKNKSVDNHNNSKR